MLKIVYYRTDLLDTGTMKTNEMTYRHTRLPFLALEKQYQKFDNPIIANIPSTDYTRY